MEEWQRDHIRTNLPTLIGSTTCRTKLLAGLLSRDVLSKYEAESLETIKIKPDQAYELYKIIETKTDGYEHLIKVLHETNQTGAVQVLVEGFPMDQVLESKVEFLGQTVKLGSLLPRDELKMIYKKLKTEITFDQYIELILRNQGKREPIKLLKNTIPPEIPYYISRIFSKRTQITVEIFKQDCPDIFVFDGIKRHELTELANPKRTAGSSGQIDRVTSRFIFLENYDDWTEIKGIVKQPAHLIHFEKGAYILEETTGGSKILNHFLKEEMGGKFTFPENELLQVSDEEKWKGICICDLPGMGKSVVLASLARITQARFPDRIVAFIPLPDIINKAGDTSNDETTQAIKIVLDFITPSPLARVILSKILEKSQTKMELFFDGFDEIKLEDMEWTKNLLKNLTNKANNIKIYVTSRPHMRHELEETLGVIAYDILPFNKANQVDFLIQFWSNHDASCDISKLDEFAKYCLQNFQRNKLDLERNHVGIPLQCRLIAQVYAKQACRYSQKGSHFKLEDFCSGANSMYDIYKSYMKEAFEKYRRLKRSGIPSATPPLDPSNSPEDAEIFHFHVFKAIELLFPELASIFSNILNINEEEYKVAQEHFKLGILEQVYNGNNLTVKFIHRTFAEFLFAEFLGHLLVNRESWKITEKQLIIVLFGVTFQTIKNASFHVPTLLNRADLFTFQNYQVVLFLNCRLANMSVESVFSECAYKTFSQMAGPQSMYKIFCSSARHDFLHIFNLIKELPKRQKPNLFHRLVSKISGPSFFGEHGLFYIFLMASKFSSVEFVEEYSNFIHQCYSCDIQSFDAIYDRDQDDHPLQFAVKRQNYELLEFLADKFTIQNSLVHLCLRSSCHDSLEGIEKRKEILSLLLNKNPNFIAKLSAPRCPLIKFIQYSHLELIKFFVQKGINVFGGDEEKNIVHRAARSLSPDEYHQLVLFIEEKRKSLDLFVRENKLGQRQLHVGVEGIVLECIRADTLEMILDKCEININATDDDDDGENILFNGTRGRCKPEIFDVLVKWGINIHATNKKGQNVLHVAAKHENMVAAKYFVELGVDYELRDNLGRRPLDVAKYHVEDIVKMDTYLSKERDESLKQVLKLFQSFF